MSTEVAQPQAEANGANAPVAPAPAPQKTQPKRNSPKYAPNANMSALVQSNAGKTNSDGDDLLGFKLDVTDGKAPFIKNVVATRDFKQGELVSVERPCLTQVAGPASTLACHGCLAPLTASEKPESGEGHNAAQPVYCNACKNDGKVDEALEASLQPLRAKMPEMAKEHGVDVVLLSIIVNLELARSGVSRPVPTFKEDDEGKDRTFQSTIKDWDAITSIWDRKPEVWRKKVGPALRALHKELMALAASGAVKGYSKASSLPRLQCDAPLIDLVLQPAYHHTFTPLMNQDTYAFGFYPGLLMYQQACAPNAHFAVVGSELTVRAIVPIQKGDPIVVSHVPLILARDQRQAVLEQQRFITCSCERCKHPMKTSVDRLIEGIVCMDCLADVLLPCEGAEENEKACEDYKTRLNAERIAVVKNLQKKLRNAKSDASKEKIEAEIASYSDVLDVPEGVMFWRCQNCDSVEPAHTIDASGPADVLGKAKNDFHQACIHKMLSEQQITAKDASGNNKSVGELKARAEELAKHKTAAMELLEPLCKAMEGRLPPYHYFVMEALPMMIQMHQKDHDWVKVLGYGIQKWDTERQLVEDRPTKSQLSMLNDIRVAAQLEAERARSDTITKQFAKKAKQAEDQVDHTNEALYGKKLADEVREARKAYKKKLKAQAQQQAQAQPQAASA